MRLIDADALIMNLDDRYSLRDISREYRDTVVYELENAPTIESPERKKGRWINKPHIYGVAYCSECDFELHINDTPYCPNCGCRMEGDDMDNFLG